MFKLEAAMSLLMERFRRRIGIRCEVPRGSEPTSNTLSALQGRLSSRLP